MNKIKAKITGIVSDEGISLVTLTTEHDVFSSVVIDTPSTADYLAVESRVWLVFKETEMAIGKDLSGGISMRNRLKSEILEIEEGKVLTRITLGYYDSKLVSVITTASAKRLLLQVGDLVEGLVKTTEISLMKMGHEAF